MNPFCFPEGACWAPNVKSLGSSRSSQINHSVNFRHHPQHGFLLDLGMPARSRKAADPQAKEDTTRAPEFAFSSHAYGIMTVARRCFRSYRSGFIFMRPSPIHASHLRFRDPRIGCQLYSCCRRTIVGSPVWLAMVPSHWRIFGFQPGNVLQGERCRSPGPPFWSLPTSIRSSLCSSLAVTSCLAISGTEAHAVGSLSSILNPPTRDKISHH
jgi:hypothetical protein